MLRIIKKIIKKIISLPIIFGYEVIIRKHKSVVDKKYSYEISGDFKILKTIKGMLDTEGLQLFQFISKLTPANNEPVLEVGVFCGRSLLALGCAFKKSQIVGVDPFFKDFYDSPAFNDEARYLSIVSGGLARKERIDIIYKTAEILDKKNNTNLKNRLKLEEKTQEQFLNSRDRSHKYKVVHIDGEHTYDAVTEIIDSFDDLLYESSFVIVDDILNPGFPGIAEAVFRHPIFKKNLFPLFYGFNKGVFIFKPPSMDFIKETVHTLLKLYPDNLYDKRNLHDGSIEVSQRY